MSKPTRPISFPSSGGDLRRDFGFRLVLLARHWRQAIDHELFCAGLSDATWRPLVYLHRLGDGVRQKDLAAAMGLDGSSVVRLLDILTKRGLVIRTEDPSDGRVKRLSLSDEGRTTLAEVHRLLRDAEERFLTDCTDQDIATMMTAMAQIEHRLEESALNDSGL